MIADNVKIISTKRLQPAQKKLLTAEGLAVLDEDFIGISFQKFTLKKIPEVLLFTSQNAVKSVIKNPRAHDLKNIPTVCVGSKTKRLLKKHHFEVLFYENYANDLTPLIKKYFTKEELAFFSGNRRMRTLPEFMTKNGICFEEYLAYKTKITPKTIGGRIDGLIFYSPSGVESYLQKNKIVNQKCFCIGTTTAGALKEVTDKIYIAQEQTIEGLLKTCVSHFKSVEC